MYMYLLYILRKYRYVIYYTIMRNYLNILPIIMLLFVSSCSNNSDDSINSDSEFPKINFTGDKYSHLYNSLYINLALKKSLDNEALSAFIENIDSMDDIKLFEKLSRISKKLYRYDDMQVIADKWIDLPDQSYLAFMYGLSAAIDNNNLDKAQTYFDGFIRVANPEDKSDYSKLIFFIIENKNRINVVNFFEKYFINNNNYELHTSFIELLFSYSLYEHVIKHIDKIGTFNDRSLVRIYANSLASVGDHPKSIKILEDYLASKVSSDRQVELELLELYLIDKNLLLVEKYIDSLLAKDPDNPDTLFKIANLLHERNLYKLSEKYLSYIVNENDRVNIMRGLNDYMLGNYIESISHFKRVNDFNYKIMAHVNISSSLNKFYGLEKSFNYLESIKKNYQDKNIQLNLNLKQISLLNEYDKFYDVIEYCTNLLEDNPHLTNILYARAMAYESIEKIDLMEQDLRKILSIDRKNANTLNALGYSLVIHTKRYDEAYSLLYKAYQFDPGNAAILDSIAWVEYNKGNYNEALRFIESSYNRDKDPEIIEHYCEILFKNKKYDTLKKVIKLELKRNENNVELMNKLRSYQNDAKL